MIIDVFRDFFLSTGLFNLDLKSFAMIIVALIFIYLAIKKGFEPLLLLPIAFGMLLVNLPLSGIMDPQMNSLVPLTPDRLRYAPFKYSAYRDL